jgi:hypothetical protein
LQGLAETGAGAQPSGRRAPAKRLLPRIH